MHDESDANGPLVLRCCGTFWTRLQGLYGLKSQEAAWTPPTLSGHQGLCLYPCRAVHTLGLRMPIDVVFVDSDLNEIKRVDRLRPNRVTVCWGAKAAIELPPGYCQRHPDYRCRISAALSECGRSIMSCKP